MADRPPPPEGEGERERELPYAVLDGPVPLGGLAASTPVRRWAAPATTALAGAACALVAGLSGGGRGVVSAGLALAVVVAFFTSGLLPLALARSAVGRTRAALLVALTNYGLRLVVLLVVLRVAVRLGAVDPRALGTTLVVCALTWTLTQAVVLARA